MMYLLRLWFGVTLPVARGVYAATGFGLMLFKYLCEAAVIWAFTHNFYLPWQFLNPLISVRMDLLQGAPDWIGWAWFAWSLPFLWIAITMSVRRSADAGSSPWMGLWVIVPGINLVYMTVMCLVPSTPVNHWHPNSPFAEAERSKRGFGAKGAVMSLGLSLIVGGLMVAVSVPLLESYGAALFVGTPLMMGAVTAYFYNREEPRGFGNSVVLGLVSVLLGGVALLLFALEGFICIAMALPLLIPLGALGGLIGKAIADSTRRPIGEIAAAVLILPVLAVAESQFYHARGSSPEYEVLTSVEIDAPREVVWQHVTHFPDLPPAEEWYFRLGIASPERARIEGQGVGATRYCEFTTGTFVEPITVWNEPERLAFDVTDQPAPMFELSPYRHVHPPHLHGYLRSNHGEFRLIELPGGRTLLEGRTWYEFDMFPRSYWTLWSHLLIHRIHERVLLHVKNLAEGEEAK